MTSPIISTTEGIIVFLDILGTRKMQKENEAISFLQTLNAQFDEFDSLSNLGGALLKLRNIQYGIKNIRFDPFKNENNIPHLELEVSTFSDTIIIALHGDFPVSDAFFIYLMGFSLIPLFRKAFINKIFLRGIISTGKFFILKRKNGILLVGPAVNDAAQSYEDSDWIGVSASLHHLPLNKIIGSTTS